MKKAANGFGPKNYPVDERMIEKKKTACVGCSRTEDIVDVRGRTRALTLNADGKCAVCVEVEAEAAADAQIGIVYVLSANYDDSVDVLGVYPTRRAVEQAQQNARDGQAQELFDQMGGDWESADAAEREAAFETVDSQIEYEIHQTTLYR